MDSLGTDVLHQLLIRFDRMEKQESQLVYIIEQLDKLHDMLENQTQKQNWLGAKLAGLSLQFDQEKMFMKEQLQGAQREILGRLGDIQRQGDDDNDDHHPTGHADESGTIPSLSRQSLQSLSHLVVDKLTAIDERTLDTVTQGHQIITLSRRTEEQITELAENNKDNIRNVQSEIKTVKDLVSRQTNTVMTFLNNQIDEKLLGIGSALEEIFSQQRATKEMVVETISKQLDKQQVEVNRLLSEKVNITTENCEKQIQKFQDFVTKIENTYASITDAPKEIEKSVKHLLIEIKHLNVESLYKRPILEAGNDEYTTAGGISPLVKQTVSNNATADTEHFADDQTQVTQCKGDTSGKYRAELENIMALVSSLTDSSNMLNERVLGVVEKIDNIRAPMNEDHREIKEYLSASSTDCKDYINKVKHELFSVVEKEAQIVRNRIAGPLPNWGKYIFYLYVDHFRNLVRSDKCVDGPPWHINEIGTCVVGRVRLQKNGDMDIYLLFGRHPREVGLRSLSGQTLQSSATVCDIFNKSLQPKDIGEVTWEVNELCITCNGGYGYKLGVTSCDKLIEEGYGDLEGYENKALLIRYDVTVL